MANPTDVLAKWTRNTVAAIPTIKAGVMAVTTSPMEKAAQAADRYAQGVQQAVTNGTYQAGLRSVSLADWQSATADKGTQRINQGVQAAQTKMGNFLTQLLPFTDRVKQQIASMPKGQPSDADARMLAAVNMMRSFKYQKRSS
jgi:hypothetical protein